MAEVWKTWVHCPILMMSYDEQMSLILAEAIRCLPIPYFSQFFPLSFALHILCQIASFHKENILQMNNLSFA